MKQSIISDASCVQHTFYTWATKGHQLRDKSKTKTWLFTTLRRAFLLTQRRQNIFAQDELGGFSENLTAVSPEGPHRSDCSQILPALAKVDEAYQAAVALFYLEDHSYKDIAEILEVPIGTVKSRIARGLTQLRRNLASSVKSPVAPKESFGVPPSGRPGDRVNAELQTPTSNPDESNRPS